MTTSFLTNHYFSKTSSVVSVAKVNKRKYKEDYIRYGVACLQKDGEYIPQRYVVHENTGEQLFEIIPTQWHLNNVHKEQPSKIDWAGYFALRLRKVVSNVSDWMQDLHLTK